MIDLDPGVVTIIMLGGVLVGVLLGYPLAIPIGALGLIMGLLLFGEPTIPTMYNRLFSILNNFILLAVPLFIFMGVILENSGIAERMYHALYVWLGGLRGGLAIVTVLVGAILAACVGVVGASVTMLALVALPAMIKRGYSKSLAAGSVCAGGTLGTLIPPSILMIVYGPMAKVSVGKLFMGAFIPGFILATLYCCYIGIRCFVQPNIAPPVPAEERAAPLIKKTGMVMTSLVAPAFLILAVLGSIFFGIAPPSEAAAMGAFAAILLSIAYRKFNLALLKDSTLTTLRVSSMIFLIAGLSVAYVGVFLAAGCGNVIQDLILSAPFGRWGAFAAIHLLTFILGFFIDILGIIFIMVPIIAPLVPLLGFDPVWFAILMMLNFQTAYMSPPFAPSIFYLRGSVDPALGITIYDIIRGVIPFVIIVIIVITICVFFPDLVLWLPSIMIR